MEKDEESNTWTSSSDIYISNGLSIFTSRIGSNTLTSNWTTYTPQYLTSSFHPWWGERSGKRKEGRGGSNIHCSKGIDHGYELLSMRSQRIKHLNSVFKYRFWKKHPDYFHQNFEDPMGRKELQEKLHKIYLRSTNKTKSSETSRL